MNNVVFISVRWNGSKERIRLDLDAIQRRRRGHLATWEAWDDGDLVEYFPGYLYLGIKRDMHVLVLTYARSEHPKLKAYGDEIPWGKTTLKVAADLTKATATWAGSDGDDQNDGTVKCTVSKEKPSRLKVAMSRVRVAQQSFKNAVMRFGACCEVSGESMSAVLDAAHVLSIEDGGSDEPENGLLLRSDLHRLFDAGLLRLQRDGSVTLHRSLSQYARDLRGKIVRAETMKRITPYLARRRLKLAKK